MKPRILLTFLTFIGSCEYKLDYFYIGILFSYFVYYSPICVHFAFTGLEA